MSLRARLVVGLLALVSAGLIVADGVTYVSLRAFLNRRVDQQLEASRVPILRALLSLREGPPPPQSSLPPGTYAQVRDGDGDVVNGLTVQQEGRSFARPAFPRSIAVPGGRSRSFEVPSVSGSLRYRVLAQPLGGRTLLLVAIPLHEVAQTLGRLLRVELVVTIVVLAAVAALSSWLVRLGLRPLRDMGRTAALIADGDLSQRVESTDPHTEAGRLGLSLNAMLGRIQSAFAERTASEERLRRFVADASHELRTPLTSIRGYAELFRRGADRRPEDLEKAMSRIEQESSRMSVLVDDLLLLARLDQGRPLDHEPVDLTEVAADAVADARVIDADRKITLASPDPVIVLGDEVRLRQVAANLLSNAITHTPSGTPVEVSVASVDGVATLEVADHGHGLDAEEAEHVFERFYRADPSRTRESGGAGLGLSIVAAIAAAHGGTACVDTSPGGGSRFRVTLPVALPDTLPEPTESGWTTR